MSIRTMIALAVLMTIPAGTAATADLVPYEAIYTITTQNWKLPVEPKQVEGTYIARIEKGCADWRGTAQLQLRAATMGDRDINLDSNANYVEAMDGTQFRFRSETRLNGQSLSSSAGVARRAVRGQPGRLQLSEPQQRIIPLPAETMFPAESVVWVNSRWRRGDSKLNYVLLDGTFSEPVHVFELRTGAPAKPDTLPAGDVGLLEAQGWRSNVTYHAYGGQDSGPLTTMTHNVLANGVATELQADLGFAEAVMKLVSIRALPQPTCN